MRKKFAEALRKMFILSEVDDHASAKTLLEIATDGGLNESELAQCRQGISKYIKRRKLLKQQLTQRGELGTLRMLTEVGDEMIGELHSAARLKVGPFSYIVYVNEDKLGLIYENMPYDECGGAICVNGIYPWSIVVTDRATIMSPEGRVAAFLRGEPAISQTEQHEDMHQFYAFLRELFATKPVDGRFRATLMMRQRLEELHAMKAPSQLQKRCAAETSRIITELACEAGRKDWDWAWVAERTQQEIEEDLTVDIKAELLAFLWSSDIAYLEKLLRHRYLRRWIKAEEDRYNLDFAKIAEKLDAVMVVTLRALSTQMHNLAAQGITNQNKLAQLAAMLNIDRPLNEWGKDM